MADDEEVTATLEAQLVVLGLWPSDTWEDEELVSAALKHQNHAVKLRTWRTWNDNKTDRNRASISKASKEWALRTCLKKEETA